MIASLKKYTIRFNLIFGLILLLAVFLSVTASASNERYHTIPLGSNAPYKSPLKGVGVVDKIISTEQSGWYELLIDTVGWPTDLFLDKRLIGHFSFSDKAWPGGRKHKAINLFLKKGKHILRLQRLYFPGLPNIRSVELLPATNLAGKINWMPNSDSMVFRKGKNFSMHLTAAKLNNSYELNINIKDADSGHAVTTLKQEIPAGTGLFQTNIDIPTNMEGVFNVNIRHLFYGQVARSFQYVVIDTLLKANASSNAKKELIARIIPTQLSPDYTSTPSHVVINKHVGSYLESNSNGVYGDPENPDYFSYKLKLPDTSGLYLVEVDYPDNEPRTFTISLVEQAVNPYALDSGVVTGGRYLLSDAIQTARIYFYPREKTPRLLFLNWLQGKKIAISEIRIYRVDENSLAPLQNKKSERKFGSFYEEPMRFPSYFGAKPTGNQWTEIYTTAKRWAEWSDFIGQNLWLQSIANYQHVMWPTDLLPGYAPSDEGAFSMLGFHSPYDMHKKDVIRSLLLMAEKYHISFIGELAIPASGYMKEALDTKFSRNAEVTSNQFSKPWLVVSDTGQTGGKSAFQPYFNPLYPDVQNWIKSIVRELALRYKDSPSFDGIAIRLMSWSFSSWQAFPSIHWGYGDFTINMFEHDTGIKIPVSAHSPNRFKERYNWLTKNYYKEWINWRVSKITDYYKALYAILKSARPDLKLYINTFGPDYSPSDWGKYGGWKGRYRKIKKIGWHKMIRESGVDPLQFRNTPGIMFSNSFQYPAGIRATFHSKGRNSDELGAIQWREAHNPDPVKLSSKPASSGTVSAVRFGNAYMEYNFPVNWIGYDHLINRKSKTLRIAAAINPAGRAMLKRYAWALSVGNIDFMTDGGLGYILGDPAILRPFMREYHSLPDIGMKKLPTNGSTSLWYGTKDTTSSYLYLVNVSGKQNNNIMTFSKHMILTRRSTGKIYMTDKHNKISVPLLPYELVVLKTTGALIKPVSFEMK